MTDGHGPMPFPTGRTSLLLVAAVVLSGITSVAHAAKPPSPQSLVDGATAIVGRMEADHRYAKELRVAKGILVLNRIGPGSGEGAADAPAVLLRHRSDGSWSEPAFLTVGALGVAGTGTVPSGDGALLLMTSRVLGDIARPDFTFPERSDLAVVGFVAREDQPLGEGDVEIWSGASGALASVALAGARFAEDGTLDRDYYGRAVGTGAILAGKVRNRDARGLRNRLPL